MTAGPTRWYSRLDYDFAKMKFPKGGEISLPIRAKHFDGWTRQFLAAHANNATVLHLGCGLDSRVFRVDPPPTVRWFDVDQAEVIELRRRVYPERAGYEMIATSVTDLAWLERVPAGAPVFVVGEGLLIYLPEDAGLALLGAITAKFPSGELAFDVYSRAMVWLTRRLPAVKRTGAVLHWGIDDSHALERAVPRLHLVEDVPFLTMPEDDRAQRAYALPARRVGPARPQRLREEAGAPRALPLLVSSPA